MGLRNAGASSLEGDMATTEPSEDSTSANIEERSGNCRGLQLDGGLAIFADCIQKVCSLQTP
ncbi:hypothetical protein F444_04534 [Phytophthora nicotianae P1976]|uniref:Uncharacterized protein n=1 Tax=Phytophthora nicotianae P1976 TaxID=1317066 RepID=A0A081AQD2_PHYNI|nr:hypothetical protein F444_04534 [Phytophthora nicotianae P1976]